MRRWHSTSRACIAGRANEDAALVVGRPETGEELFGAGVWVPPALTGNLVARGDDCCQRTLAFVVGKVRCERLVGCIDLSPLANTLRGIISMVANHSRMFEHALHSAA